MRPPRRGIDFRMANFSLKFSVSDSLMPVIDSIRGPVSREDFFRKALELGISDLIDNTLRMHRDYLNHAFSEQLREYRQGRALLRVDDTENTNPKVELLGRANSAG